MNSTLRYSRYTFLLLIILFLFSCTAKRKDPPPAAVKKQTTREHTIAILPFSGVDTGLINALKKSIGEELAVNCFVLPAEPLPAFAFYQPRQRYIADSLLQFLGRKNNHRYEKVIGVTVKDISTRKGAIANWGILGLGTCPGESCVVSSFRAGKNKVSRKDFLRRMTTLALHELGHTYGLEHCPVASCLMKDAEGKMNLDDGDSYCEKCRNDLRKMGILK